MISVFRFVLLVVLCGCVSENPARVSGVAFRYRIQGDGYLVTADLSKYQQLDFNRKSSLFCPVNFDNKKIRREENELLLEILRPKGCPANYELVWDSLWQESSPRRMQVYLTAGFVNCPPGTATELDVIRVDLAKATQSSLPMDPFSGYLCAHCSFRDFNCTGNCDLTIPV